MMIITDNTDTYSTTAGVKKAYADIIFFFFCKLYGNVDFKNISNKY